MFGTRSSRLRFTTLLAALLAAACSESKDVKAWWELEGACPGDATVTQADGNIFCAKEGVRHGRFDKNVAGGLPALSGGYLEGKRDGVFVQRASDGRVLGSYRFASGTGTEFVWRDDGTVETRSDYVEGVLSGSFTRFAADGVELEKGGYVDGRPVGAWEFRDSTGQLTRRVMHKNGEVWETQRFEDGKLASMELSAAAKAHNDAVAAAAALERKDLLAKQFGLLGSLKVDSSAFASLTGSGGFDSALDDPSIYGGLIGTEVGDGFGGGGTGTGTIGSGQPRGRLGKVTVSGQLDSAVIRRFLRRKQRSFAACVSKPGVLEFTIGATGAVTSVGATSACLAKVIKSVKFPRPKSGTVKVKALLTFRSPKADAIVEPPKKPKMEGGAVKRRVD